MKDWNFVVHIIDRGELYSSERNARVRQSLCNFYCLGTMVISLQVPNQVAVRAVRCSKPPSEDAVRCGLDSMYPGCIIYKSDVWQE